MLGVMSIPVFTTLVLGVLVTIGGGFILAYGQKLLRDRQSISEQDVRAFGLVHILIGGWFLLGAVTEDPNTTLGACLLMTKARYCTTT